MVRLTGLRMPTSGGTGLIPVDQTADGCTFAGRVGVLFTGNHWV